MKFAKSAGGMSWQVRNSMDDKTIKAAETVLAKGYAVELRPVKDGIKVIQVIRQQVAKQ